MPLSVRKGHLSARIFWPRNKWFYWKLDHRRFLHFKFEMQKPPMIQLPIEPLVSWPKYPCGQMSLSYTERHGTLVGICDADDRCRIWCVSLHSSGTIRDCCRQ